MSAADRIYDRLDRAIERGEMTEREAREAYLDAEEEAAEQLREDWR